MDKRSKAVYDELLEYYFYPNGQCQESSRDQFYSLLDNRLLKGIEFNYNLSRQ